MQRPEGDPILRVLWRRADRPDRDAEDVDAVADGIVDGGEHVGVEARVLDVWVGTWDWPAHLVDGEAGQRGAAGGSPTCEAAKGGDAADHPAGDGGGCVGPMAVVVPGGPEGVCCVERAVVGFIALDVVPSAD